MNASFFRSSFFGLRFSSSVFARFDSGNTTFV